MIRSLSLIAATLCILSGCFSGIPEGGNTALALRGATGSMAPNLATGPDGTVAISWIEPDSTGHALRFSILTGEGWQNPRTVARGDNWFVNWADFPSVIPLSGSVWAAHWLVSQPEGGYAYDINLSFSTDNGDTWSEEFIPHQDGTPTEHGFVTLFSDTGDLGMVWLDGRKMINDYDANDVTASGMTLRAASFPINGVVNQSALIDELTCDCCQTDVALSATGPVAAYRDRTTDEIRDIYVSRRIDGEWQSGTRVSNDDWEIPACPVNGPAIQGKGRDVVVTWFTAGNDQPRVMAAWSRDSGETFSSPVKVNQEAPLGHVGAALLPNGDLLVVWHSRTNEDGTKLLIRRVSQDGVLGAIHPISEAHDVFAFSVPQLALYGENLVIAWTRSVDHSYSIGTVLVPIGKFN